MRFPSWNEHDLEQHINKHNDPIKSDVWQGYLLGNFASDFISIPIVKPPYKGFYLRKVIIASSNVAPESGGPAYWDITISQMVRGKPFKLYNTSKKFIGLTPIESDILDKPLTTDLIVVSGTQIGGPDNLTDLMVQLVFTS